MIIGCADLSICFLTRGVRPVITGNQGKAEMGDADLNGCILRTLHKMGDADLLPLDSISLLLHLRFIIYDQGDGWQCLSTGYLPTYDSELALLEKLSQSTLDGLLSLYKTS